MSDLIDTTEMYLRTVYELEEEGITPLRARIAERLGHSGPTVSQTVARMERDGLMRVSGDRHLELTDEGRVRAMRVMRKHRLAERLLVDVIGLEWEFVHDEACRWEHVMSERVERKVLGMLTGPVESPYGNPIPGLEELGAVASDLPFRDGVRTLVEALDGALDGGRPAAEGASVPARPADGVTLDDALVVRRLGEPLQTDTDLMGVFARAGLRPGARLAARRAGRSVEVTVGDTTLTLEEAVAGHVFVGRPLAVV